MAAAYRERGRRWGYRTISVADGRSALAALPTARPDLVILDMMMPDMDGLGVLRAMRFNPAAASIPVIMCSALSDPALQAEARRTGATDYFVKGATDSHVWSR